MLYLIVEMSVYTWCVHDVSEAHLHKVRARVVPVELVRSAHLQRLVSDHRALRVDVATHDELHFAHQLREVSRWRNVDIAT